ncbi:MAG: sialate O-acetylesterase [Opitutaceae bacterium]|nr:sialate O-acetylesterase [Opitutaceae bacterium]
MKLFLLIGQSNMAGRGKIEEQDKVPHPRVFILTKALTWVPAVDPLHYDLPSRVGVGLASTFARVVAEAEPRQMVGLIPAAFGGSALDEWKPGGKHYSNAVARAREAMKRGQLVGILWHQGESDGSAEQIAIYAERFRTMITQLRKDLDADVPVLVGELGRFRPANAPLNVVLATLSKTVSRCVFVPAEGLNDKGDGVHFDSAALREFGRRYARAWLETVK